MKTEFPWKQSIPNNDPENCPVVIYAMAMHPEGTNVVVGAGSRLLVFDPIDGDCIRKLKGHRAAIYTVVYSHDGTRFASGGADKTIVIWTSKFSPILKYSHTESIQCLAYNPITTQLASATAIDFGLWSPEQKSVQKFKVTAKVLCCAWTSKGQYIALGQYNGHISIRDKNGDEKVRINRHAPIWTLKWCPSVDGVDSPDVLAVGCWDKTLSFWKLSGARHGSRDIHLDYDPCVIEYIEGGEYIIIAGSNQQVSLYSKEGTFLLVLAKMTSWVWSLVERPLTRQLVVSCNDGPEGLVVGCNLHVNTVHGLYQDRYSHRVTMTDVVVQHLVTEQKIKIVTNDYVKRIALYRGRLAIQLPKCVRIYEETDSDAYDMTYSLAKKVDKELECDLLVVTSQHLILCQESRLQLYDFFGEKVREWVLEAMIRYIRVVGGPQGREGILVGLKSGEVYKIFIDNHFPVLVVKHGLAVRCLDLNCTRDKLALVDEDSKVVVYDLTTKQRVYEDDNANSVAWNASMEDILCYSGDNKLSIKMGEFPVHRQALEGFVVGFAGSKIFCLHNLEMHTIDVPQSPSLYQHLSLQQYDKAYATACLGVTESDWRALAIASLSALRTDIARKAFIRIRDVRYIELLERIEVSRQDPDCDLRVLKADILAYQGKYEEASRAYVRSGHPRKAVEMFLDLRDWKSAQNIVESLEDGQDQKYNGMSIQDLLKKQAEWLLDASDYRAAADMYWGAREYDTAINILGENAFTEDLIVRVRKLDKMRRKELALAASYLEKHREHTYAKEVYLKMEDIESLMSLHVKLDKWEEAFQLAKSHPQYVRGIFLPYAKWLAMNDRFEEAQKAFQEAGHPEQSLLLLQKLVKNAIHENRYSDAGYYYWLLSQEHVRLATPKEHKGERKLDRRTGKLLTKHLQFKMMAEVYYAYDSIYANKSQPFTTLSAQQIFDTALFLLRGLSKESITAPYGISVAQCLYALTQQCRDLGAFKLARKAYARLGNLRLPAVAQRNMELSSLMIRATPYSDKEDVICVRCGSANPLLSDRGSLCVVCGHRFTYSFLSFEILPLVEFQLEKGLGDEEALKLMSAIESKAENPGDGVYTEDGGAETLAIGPDTGAAAAEDLFDRQLNDMDHGTSTEWPAIIVDRKTLAKFNPREVFRMSPGHPSLPTLYFKSIISYLDDPIAQCSRCHNVFNEGYPVVNQINTLY
ncbi:hypothetical protein AAMO2058_000213600 [Amorphochlora amoebiformis]